MFTERTSVGLDVHARSVAAAAIDGVTGELFQARLTPSHEHIRSWLRGLPGPVAVAYEAGPTGFGLSRSLTAAGIRCEVAAPSKLQRPAVIGSRPTPGTRCTWPGCCAWTRSPRWSVPTVEQEAARDLVRAREDCRGDLMRARHRLSKLLLRHGIVYYGGKAWTGTHDAWLRRAARSTHAGDPARLRGRLRGRAAPSRPAGTGSTPRSPTMAADSEFTPLVRRLGCLRGISHPDRVRAGGRDRRLAPVHRHHHRLLRRPGAHRVLLRRQSRVQGSITKTGNTHARRLLVEAAWHHRARYVAGKTMRDRWDLAPPAARARGDAGQPAAAPPLGQVHRPPQEAHVIANVAIARELAGWCWSLAVLDD